MALTYNVAVSITDSRSTEWCISWSLRCCQNLCGFIISQMCC